MLEVLVVYYICLQDNFINLYHSHSSKLFAFFMTSIHYPPNNYLNFSRCL